MTSELSVDGVAVIPEDYGIFPAYDCACPKCGERPFRPFMRGQVYRSWSLLAWLKWKIGVGEKQRTGFCLICWKCKEIVGVESERRFK